MSVPHRSSGAGRPPAASPALLQEAALELFTENGYAGTSVEHITTRAGVSRNTFFNYFASKSDVFWLEVDAALPTLVDALAVAPADARPCDAVVTAVCAFAAEFGPDAVPFVLTQHELIGSVAEVTASAVSRLAAHAELIRVFLVGRGMPEHTAMTAGFACAGATVAAALAWAGAGAQRGSAESYVRDSLRPVMAGFIHDGAAAAEPASSRTA